MTLAAPTARRAPDPATRRPRGKSKHVLVEAKGRDAGVREWRTAFRAANIPDGAKAVGFTMSTYGNTSGGEIFPGLKRLAADHHCDEKTIRNHIIVLVFTGWIRLTSNHRAGARRKDADEYQLTIPDQTLSLEAPQEDQDLAGIDDWHLLEPDDGPDEEPDDQWTDFSTGPDDHWKDLSGPVDKVVQPPRDVPSNKEQLSRADRRSAPGPGGPRINADASTANGVTESQETSQLQRVPKQRKASQIPDEVRAEFNRYIALIPHLSVDEVQEVLDDLWEVREGVWKWAHDGMRRDYKEPIGKETKEYFEPETPEKARLMYVYAFRCTLKSGVWHECLTDPLDAVDEA